MLHAREDGMHHPVSLSPIGGERQGEGNLKRRGGGIQVR
jgi:hypothetical protein